MDILALLATVLISLCFTGLSIWLGFRRFRSLLQFNIQGSNPMVRLVPNVSYTLLFLMLLLGSM